MDPSLFDFIVVVNLVPSKIALISPIKAPESNSSNFY